MDEPRRRRGRPRIYPEGTTRNQISLRTTGQLKRALQARCAETGRSLAQETELILELWNSHEESLGGWRLARLLRLLARIAMQIESELGRGSMFIDYQTFVAVEAAWLEMIARARPSARLAQWLGSANKGRTLFSDFDVILLSRISEQSAHFVL